MIQNEFEPDETITHILDDDGLYEDVQIFVDGSSVFIRQWMDELQMYNIIELSHDMWNQTQLAMNLPEGLYATNIGN